MGKRTATALAAEVATELAQPPTLAATDLMPAASQLRTIPLALIDPHPDNPRTDVGDVEELAQSIRENGGRLLQPIVVVPAVKHRAGENELPDDRDDGRYVVIAGHRRRAACELLALSDVDCIVRDDLIGPTARIAMLVENLQRVDLSALEEAQAFEALQQLGLKQRDIADRVGRNQSHISKRLGLLKLDDDARKLLADGTLSLEQAVTVAKMPKAVQAGIAADIATDIKTGTRSPESTIRQAEARLEELADRGRAIKGAKESGVRYLIVDEPGHVALSRAIEAEAPNAQELRTVRYTGDTAHVELSCHLVVIGPSKNYTEHPSKGWGYHWAVQYCTDPQSHQQADGVAVQDWADTGQDDAARAAQRAEWEERQRQREERQAQLQALRDARQEFIRALLAKKLPRGTVDHVLRAGVLERVVVGELYEADRQVALAGQALGLSEHEREAEHGKSLLAVVERLHDGKGDDLLRLALATRLIADDAELHALLLHGDHPQAHLAAAHLTFLAQAGYQPAELEVIPDDLQTIEHHLCDFGLVADPPVVEDVDVEGDLL
jgi:ParB/RepB/Spo0J family partition protein